MTRRFVRRAMATWAAALLAAFAAGPAAHGDPKPPTVEAWQQSTSISLDADGALTDVQALPSGDVWAVGQQQIWDVWRNRGAIRHWNGTAWSEVALRDSMGASVLRGVSASSATDVWAVGDGHDGLPYLAHGDTSGFDRIRVPALTSRDRLTGVDVRPGRVFAVGSRGGHPLIVTGQQQQWNAASFDRTGSLYAVSGSIAVGDTGKAPLAFRYSSGAWAPMPMPSVPGGYLRDVQADGAKRAVAVGGVYTPAGDVQPLVLSWNGKRWSRVTLPVTGAQLYGVAGDGQGRFWVSGFDPSTPGEPFLMRLEKGAATVIRGGSVTGRSSVRLQAVTYLPDKRLVWAVGHAVDADDRYTGVVETFGPRTAKSTVS
ncbi:hypothetical protein ACIBH1_08200 [Nonomuraea sp. NPDC050663]|uniref:hypothetical protein n=1 Tax=Nonomuraea sp. NPDC050663 TaxID=3364370 RepID=UPI003795044C